MMRNGLLVMLFTIGAALAAFLGGERAAEAGRGGSGERCNVYGCWSPGGGCNVYGCWDRGGGCNVYGCWRNGGGCNVYGCWHSSRGSCNVYGCTSNGECNVYGCPGDDRRDRRRPGRRASLDTSACEPAHAGPESEAFFAAAATVSIV